MTTARRSRACRKTSGLSRPASRRCGIEDDTQANGPLRGHCRVDLAHLVAAALLDHDAVVIPVTPALMPAIVTVHADFRAGAVPVVMIAAALDHDGLGAGNAGRRNRDRTKRRDDITKLLHCVLLTDKCRIKP